MNNKFNIEQTVYYVLDGTTEGIVVNWMFDGRSGLYVYEVSFGPGMTYTCYDTELMAENTRLY